MKATPQHIAVIMDGNGRWAQRRMLPRVAGHHRGVESARLMVQYCVEHKIPVLSLFAFSSENWRRPVTEVKLLMSLLQKLLAEEVQQLHSNNVRVRVLGDLQSLDPSLQAAINNAHTTTADNTGLQLNIAINYGGRWDIIQAVRQLAQEIQNGSLQIGEINEANLQKHLQFSAMPDPDLLIRTSGEQRISNFMLWNLAYTEIYFSETLWPDFAVADIEQALEFFAQRERRFGLVSEHV